MTKSDGWDSVLPEDLQLRWKSKLTKVVRMDTFYFNRSCKPLDADGCPEVLVFHDCADPGHGGCVYLRSEVQKPSEPAN